MPRRGGNGVPPERFHRIGMGRLSGQAARKPPDRPLAVARIAAIMAIAVAVTVLFGWLIDSPALSAFWPGAVAMKTNAAIGVVLTGTAVLLKADNTRRLRFLVGDVLGLTCAVIGLITLAEYVTGWHPGIDELLFTESGSAHPNRMASSGAVVLVLLGVAVVLAGRNRATNAASQLLAAVVTVMALAVLVGYGYGWSVLAESRRSTAIAVPAAVATMLLGVALVLITGDPLLHAADVAQSGRDAGPATAPAGHGDPDQCRLAAVCRLDGRAGRTRRGVPRSHRC